MYAYSSFLPFYDDRYIDIIKHYFHRKHKKFYMQNRDSLFSVEKNLFALRKFLPRTSSVSLVPSQTLPR